MENKMNITKIENIARKILERGHRLFLVGGCVRNSLLNLPIKDLDLVTSMRPDELIETFSDHNIDIVGKTFGVVIVDSFEIATYRRDVYNSDIAHSKGADNVEFALSIEEDLGRRDLTINSIAKEIIVDINTNIVLGDYVYPSDLCLDDIMTRTIRFVGDPNERIKEDPCRILRAFRFFQLLGDKATMTESAFSAIVSNTDKIDLIAKERIRLEFMKMMEIKSPLFDALNLMLASGILAKLIPPLAKCHGVDGGPYHNETVFDHGLLACDSVDAKYPLTRLAALMHDIGKIKTQVIVDGVTHFYSHELISERLTRKWMIDTKFSLDEINVVCELISNHMFYFEKISKDSSFRRLMSKLKYNKVRDLLRIRLADRRGNKKKLGVPFMFKYVLRRIRKIEADDQALHISDLCVDGNDLIQMGIQPGPIFKTILEDILNRVLDVPEFNLDKNAILEYIHMTYKNSDAQSQPVNIELSRIE